MKFYIDFNKESKDKVLEQIGAELVRNNKEDIGYFIELNSFEDFEELENKLAELMGYWYSLIISFVSNTIYIDKDI